MTSIGWYHGEETHGRFGRMFGNLAPLPASAPQPEELGTAMGGGILDDDNEAIPAGFTYLGQFIDHDIIYDPTSLFEQQIDVNALENFRTPVFELDSLYGSGPAVSSSLYDRQQPGKLLLDEDREHDLPRNSQGTALIGDPRNDQNLITAQLHLAFIKFHNTVFDIALGIHDGVQDKNLFEKTQRLVRWHYQWIIYRKFLPLIVGQEVVDDIVTNGRKFYQWKGYPFIPFEFSIAAYRFGHSQARSIYRINDHLGNLPLFTARPPSGKRQDLRGGRIKKIDVLNWKNFFETGVPPTPGATRASKKIDTNLAGSLQALPSEFFPGGPSSLAVRTLLRGAARGLPSGQDVALEMAKQMQFEPLTDKEVWSRHPQFKGKPAPLWYYILIEADVRESGRRLGPVGGRIVAEVFLGLLMADQESFLIKRPTWRPVLSGEKQDDFTIVDLLKLAGVDTQ